MFLSLSLTAFDLAVHVSVAHAYVLAKSGFAIGDMFSAVLKLYFIGTALTFFAVIYGIVDSVGGTMYLPNHHRGDALGRATQQELSPRNHPRQSSVTKRVGS
ncbi:hypothetical protein JOB18_043610 [Solea senegalensis]|uniref:Uncharacterized protein n=1 Tax=Solea senegalensis TaxID=28829 RepID=A0AAV6QZS4_SOLSE|nr:hypothetical protein JOB18_043610 [Solea senegalensis]